MDGFRSATMFCVVDFVGRKKRTVVPDTWLSVTHCITHCITHCETHCLLPPKVSDSDLDVLVRNLAEPGQGWQLLEVSSLETFGSYYEAKKKLKKSEASSQRKRKKPSYLEDYLTLDSDDSRKPFTVFGVDFDEEAMSENEWTPPPEFSPSIENVSTVNKTILNDTRPRNPQISQSLLSSQKENIDITCDCQSTCHSTFLRALHSMQKQLDRTNQMVQQLLGGQKQTHTELKRVLQSQPVNQINGQEEMDVSLQGSANFPQRFDLQLDPSSMSSSLPSNIELVHCSTPRSNGTSSTVLGECSHVDQQHSKQMNPKDFPYLYKLPQFPLWLQNMLDTRSPLCKEPKCRRAVIHAIFDDLLRYGDYPSPQMFQETCRSLVDAYPILKDKQCANAQPYDSWVLRLRDKFKKYRSRHAELSNNEEIIRMKAKFGSKRYRSVSNTENSLDDALTSVKRSKILQSSEYAEDEFSIKVHVKVLQEECHKRKPNEDVIRDKMIRTFQYRAIY